MRNLSASKAPGDTSRRGSAAGINTAVNQAHAKYKVKRKYRFHLEVGYKIFEDS